MEPGTATEERQGKGEGEPGLVERSDLRTPYSALRTSYFVLCTVLSLTACTGGDGRQVLTVYSPHGADLLGVAEQRFEALHPDVDVQTVDMGSQEVLDRVRSERANPQADVWWGAPAPMFETAARDSLLAPFQPTWAGALPADARSSRGYWHGTFLTPEVIAFNREAIPVGEEPRDWDDVLDPRWKNKVLIRDPMASGTMRTIFGMMVDRSIRETGDTAQAYQWLRRLDGQTKEYVLNPTLLLQKLARREGLITLWDMPDVELAKAKSGLPIDYVFPASGTPLLVDAVAVVKGTRNPELAREFVEFVGGDALLATAARDFHRLPARADFPSDSLPEALQRARAQIVPEPINWDRLQQNGSQWMRHWDEHVRGQGRR